jgi:polyketide synthase PksL
MIDFFEYVVSELKSKRLSKANAVELIKQFSGRCSDSIAASVIHPLLHRNTSYLNQQRYTSVFTGDEFFLAEHRMKAEGNASQKVLPGAAFLEMARAAIVQALPGRAVSAALELRDIVWARPIVICGNKEVSITLTAEGDERINYEIQSQEGERKVVHCDGRAILDSEPSPAKLNPELLKNEMRRGRLDPPSLCASFASIGMIYGAGFQAIAGIHRGDGQALAHLRLPRSVRKDHENYVLHPSLIDGAFQACIGLADDFTPGSGGPRLPFALDSLRIFASCSQEMFAWLRYAPGSGAGDDVVRVDIDLYDEQGNVCVQFRNFSYRVLQKGDRTRSYSQQQDSMGLRSFVPVWNPVRSGIYVPALSEFANTLLLGTDESDLEWVLTTCPNACATPISSLSTVEIIEETLRHCSFDRLLWIAPDVIRRNGRSRADGEAIIGPQETGVLAVFRIVKALLHLGYGDRELRWTIITGYTQYVSDGSRTQPANAAIFGLIGSLAKEYPQWKLSLIDVDSLEFLSAGECLSIAPDERGNGLAYRNGGWFRQEFEPVPIQPAVSHVAYRQNGVYVVIGGAGGLGEAWTRFMLEHYKARVVWIGRRPCDESIEDRVKSLTLLGPAPRYIEADATKPKELDRACQMILKEYPAIHGVVHSAVVLLDQTIARMDEGQFKAALSAKVDISVNMDRVFGGQDLDFMLFFSSVVSFVKSPGQSNYAAGCTFKDSFAQSLRQRRPFPIKVMNWGYWGSVGGAANEYYNKSMAHMGIGSIEPDEGMACLQMLLGSELNQLAVIRMIGGEDIPYVTISTHTIHDNGKSATSVPRLRNELFNEVNSTQHTIAGSSNGRMGEQIHRNDAAIREAESSPSTLLSPPAAGGERVDTEGSLREKAISYFQKLLASTLKMRPEQIDPRRPLADYGLDSILVGQLTYKLRKAFSGVTATLLFEVKNIEGLTDYFLEIKGQELAAVLLPSDSVPRNEPRSVPKQPGAESLPAMQTRRSEPSPVGDIVPRAPVLAASLPPPLQTLRMAPRSTAGNRSISDVAVVGMSGRYPRSNNLKEFWKNLSNGVNCITEIPRDRWKWEEYYDSEIGKPGRIYTRWGGFLEGIDRFDPLFFRISPAEARRMDPQERVFLECCYNAIEDAGYRPENLSEDDKVGVFVGVMNSRYAPQPAHFSIANRVSYLFNFQGPSLAVDTACSSSLTAIHLALESIYNEESVCAIAGGVNLIIDPVHYFQLTEMTMLSRGNECKAFGEADGVVDAEGVGVVVLKPLHRAQRDGDHIYGVVKGSAINAGGRTNGYTVPNSSAQSKLVSQALKRANVSAQDLSYIEAHGTGTPLGDPIEIAGLTRAFGDNRGVTQYCSIGSLKSNIGHCESAAGIAGLTKVLLQLQHRQLVPSLHSERPNPEIDFAQTPFRVQARLEYWKRPLREIGGVMQEIPRLAGVSSFGAGGANAHIVVQEYLPPTGVERPAAPIAGAKHVIVISARDTAQLMQKVSDLLNFVREGQPSGIETGEELDLASLAYTLQVGREAMEERLGLVVGSVQQLAQKLEAWLAGACDIEDVHRGQLKRGQESLSFFSADADLRETVDKWIANRKVSKLLELWTKGLDVDWSKLHSGSRPRRMSLPVNPFAKERYWTDFRKGEIQAKAAGAAILHPLLHRNISDFSGQRYSSTFAGDEFFLVDHRVNLEGHANRSLLPAVVYLEMARAAMEHAWPERHENTVLELRNVVWAAPLVISQSTEIRLGLWSRDGDEADFQIYSLERGQETIHCQGLAAWSEQREAPRLNVEQLKAEMKQDTLERESVYSAWAGMGVLYGPTFQAITALHRGDGQVLARLRLPPVATDRLGDFVLHPSLLDGALQTAIGLIDGASGFTGMPPVPFGLDSLRVLSPPGTEMLARVCHARSARPDDGIVKLDIDLFDESGNVCVQLRGLCSRALRKESVALVARSGGRGSLLAVPVWEASRSLDLAVASEAVHTEHYIVLCGLAEVAVEKLMIFLPDSQCLSLPAEENENPADTYTRVALACFKRIKTVLQGKPQGKVLFQIVVGGEGEQVLMAGLWGMLRTASLENPQLIGQLLLVPPNVSSENLAGHLKAEMFEPSNGQIRYMEPVRQVLHWREVETAAEVPVGAFKDEGVYLVTGGLGGLGILFAKEIFTQAPLATVILAGRSQLNGEKQSLLAGLRASHGQLSYRQVDVADLGKVQELIAAIGSEYGQLNGILHSAGVVEDNFILRKESAEFQRVLAPKVTGTYNLDRATRNLDLDFFVLFSSISGAAGHVGQADYAAANGFMDQFAAYRNELVAGGQRCGSTRSINWGAWQAGGMGVDAPSRELLKEIAGVEPMQNATGIQALNRCIALPNHQNAGRRRRSSAHTKRID